MTYCPKTIVQILDAARTTALTAGSLIGLFPTERDACLQQLRGCEGRDESVLFPGQKCLHLCACFGSCHREERMLQIAVLYPYRPGQNHRSDPTGCSEGFFGRTSLDSPFCPFSTSTLDPRLRALGSNLEQYMIRQLALDSATALQKPCPPRFRNWPSGSTTALQQLPKDAHGLVRFGSRAPKSKT